MNKEQVFQQAREQLSNSYPSIFTKDDVLRLIVDMEKDIDDIAPEKEESYIIRKDRMDVILERIKKCIEESIRNLEPNEVVNEDDIELEINYGREISIDINCISHEAINDAVEEGIKEFEAQWEEEMKELIELEEDNNDDESDTNE